MVQAKRRVEWRWLLAAGLAAAWAGGCTAPASAPEQGRDEFRQTRREAELNAKIATLEVKLDEARQLADGEKVRCDRVAAELLAERNARLQEKRLFEMAVDMNAESTKQLEELRQKQQDQQTNDRVIQSLRKDLVEWSEKVKQRDAELAKLRQQVGQMQEEMAALRRQAQR